MAIFHRSAVEGKRHICAELAGYVAMVLSMAALGVAQDKNHQRLKISLQPVRWQTLPAEIRAVRFGPDGRGWLGLAPGEAKDVDIRASLEREYREENPQLRGASLALLEPDGRAWFQVKSNELWGYDGQTWIERKASSGSSFTGYCTTRGQLSDNHANRFAGGRAWFRDEQGLHVFDGKDWSYAVLCPPINSEPSLPRFSVSPSGKYAVAMTPRVPGRTVGLKNPDLWFWTADNPIWKKLPVVWKDKTSVFASFCITDEGKLWCTPGNALQILDLAGSRDVADRFATLIADLDNDDWRVRQQATERLDAVAELVLPRLQAAHSSAPSPEAKRRLEAIIQRVTGSAGNPTNRPNQRPVASVNQQPEIGGYRIQAVGDIFQDTSGKIFLFAMLSEKDKAEQQGGVLIASENDKPEFFPIGRVTNILSPSNIRSVGISHGPILTFGGDSLWIGSAQFDTLSRRLNLKTGEVVKQDYDTNLNFSALQAVHPDGLAVLGRTGLGVFSPDVSDPRPVLKAAAHPIGFPVCIVATDGKLWVQRQEGLSRFDGKDWEIVSPVERAYMYPMLAGCAGIMLCNTSITHVESGYTTEYALFQGKKLIGIAPLRKLIADHAELIITGFPPSYTPVQYGGHYRFWIATDTRRNIWLHDREGVGVFAADKWIKMRDLSNIPTFIRSAPSYGLLSVGDGSKVFFSHAVAAIEGEKMDFIEVPGPKVDVDAQMPFGFRDHQGVFFFPSYVKEIPTNNFRPGTPEYFRNMPRREYRTLRITEKGMVDELPIDGWPFLIDRSGKVWLAQMVSGRPTAHFWIWHDGKILQELRIPNATYMGAICSDKPGSVYVGTSLGLHHLVDVGSDGERNFQLRETYATRTGFANQFCCPYSDLFGLAIVGSSAVTFIQVPKE